jgi:hypothetical protein
MLRISLVDANQKASSDYVDRPVSIVSGWLLWEIKNQGLAVSAATEADIVLLVFSGSIDWVKGCTGSLRRRGINPAASKRNMKPYIIAGGPVDATPFTALSVADAITVGEAYNFIRRILDGIKRDWSISDVRDWIIAYPHAIERSQISELRIDQGRPWLLAEEPLKLASPDPYVDWDIPPIRSDDHVVRVLAEKGCHGKCLFCATTYRQSHRINTDEAAVLGLLRQLKSRHERIQLLSNDPMFLPYFRKISAKLDSQSFTIRELTDPENRAAIIRAKVGIARFGVEGISERIRDAYAKPISNGHLLDLAEELNRNHVNIHLFFIVGSPGEEEADWVEFRKLYHDLCITMRWGMNRIKFTTFRPCPPAPLARFVPGKAAEDRLRLFFEWVQKNSASRHIFCVGGRGGSRHVRDVAEQLGVSCSTVNALMLSDDHVYDLMPSADDARRGLSEIIEWPLSVETRYRISSIYARRMGISSISHAI